LRGWRKVTMSTSLFFVMLVVAGCGSSTTASSNPIMQLWEGLIGIVSQAIELFAKWTHDYGIAIIIVTLIIRVLTLPLMLKQLRYTKAMQSMQPELKKIKELHQGNKEKINEESMKVMQQYGANPLTGCFPMIVQMPILLALYRAIYYNHHIQSAKFLGVLLLGKPDPTYILPLLAAGTTFLQSKMMAVGNDSQQRMMLLIMPIMILFMSARFPAALSLYWVFGNLFTIVQTYFTRTLPARSSTAPGGGSS